MKKELTVDFLVDCYLYKEMNFKQIAELAGVQQKLVGKKIKGYGIPIRDSSYHISKEELYDLYINKQYSTKDIGKLIDRSQLYVRCRMKEFGIEARNSGTAQAMKIGISFNENFFDTWNSDMAYLLGFVYADGNICDYRFRIALGDKDGEFLHKIADLINFPKDKIRHVYNNKLGRWFWQLSVSRRDFALRLMELGLTPNKSKTKVFPYVPDEYLSDFIRGYFDGNGSISITKNRPNLNISCGSEQFIKTLSEKISIIIGDNVKYYTDYRNNVNYYIAISKKYSIIKFYGCFYYDNCFCLQRKKDKFLEYMSTSCFQ